MPDGERRFTIDQVMKIYLDTKDAAEALAKRQAAEMEPLTKRLELAKTWMLDYLQRQGLENARTDLGMVYKSTIMSATVDPEGGWDALLRHILMATVGRGLDSIEEGGSEAEALEAMLGDPALALLHRAVNKTAVKELMEQQGAPPPGVKIAHLTQVGVRRS